MRVEVELNKSLLGEDGDQVKTRKMLLKNDTPEQSMREIETGFAQHIIQDCHTLNHSQKFIVSDRAESCQKALNSHLMSANSYEQSTFNNVDLLGTNSMTMIEYNENESNALDEQTVTVLADKSKIGQLDQAQGCETAHDSLLS